MKRTNTVEMGKLTIKATYEDGVFTEAVLTSKATKLDTSAINDLINTLAEITGVTRTSPVTTNNKPLLTPELQKAVDEAKKETSPLKKLKDGRMVAEGMLIERLDKARLPSVTFHGAQPDPGS